MFSEGSMLLCLGRACSTQLCHPLPVDVALSNGRLYSLPIGLPQSLHYDVRSFTCRAAVACPFFFGHARTCRHLLRASSQVPATALGRQSLTI